MKKLLLVISSFIAVSVLSGCVSLNSVSLTQVPEKRDHLVTANASDYLFLGFTTQNDFVDEAIENLKAQCRDGKLTGILTKHQTTSYVLVFKREVIASGYCNTAEG
jgi:predicted small secreted protein